MLRTFAIIAVLTFYAGLASCFIWPEVGAAGAHRAAQFLATLENSR